MTWTIDPELLASTANARALDTLRLAFPGWQFELLNPRAGVPRWWAHRAGPISRLQWRAGVRHSLGRSTPERLAEALGRWAALMAPGSP